MMACLDATFREKRVKHSAFISYSRAADETLAPALHTALEKLARPWYRFRALNVFRDKKDLSASPHLWGAIERALSESEWFLLLASPAAAKSTWVDREVRWWVANRTDHKPFIVLTEGEIAWDASADDFDWARTNAVPRSLAGCYAGEPLYVDLRWTRGAGALTLRNATFRDAAMEIAAPLHGMNKSQLAGEDARHTLRVRQLAAAVFTVVAGLAAYAVWQWRVAETERQAALGRGLAATAQVMLNQRGTLLHTAGLLAVEAMRRNPSVEANRALRSALGLLPTPLVEIDCKGASDLRQGEFSNDGRYVATVDEGGAVRIADTASGKQIASFSASEPRQIAFRPGGTELLVGEGSGKVHLIDFGVRPAKAQLLIGAGAAAFAFDPTGATMALAAVDGTTRLWRWDGMKELALLQNQKLARAVAVNRDAVEVAVTTDDAVQIFVRPGPPSQSIPTNGDQRVAYSPDGRNLAMVSERSYQIHLFDVIGKRQLLFDNHQWDFAFSADGQTLALASPEWFAETYDLKSCRQSGERFVMSPTGLLTPEPIEGVVSCRRGPRVRHDDSVVKVFLNRDGSRLATTSRDGTARVWEPYDGTELLRILADGPEIIGMSFTQDSKQVSAWGGKGCRGWVGTGARDVASFEYVDGVHALAFSKDGRYLAMTGRQGLGQGPIRVANLQDRKIVSELKFDRRMPRVTSVAFDQSGERLLVNGTFAFKTAGGEVNIAGKGGSFDDVAWVDRAWKTRLRVEGGTAIIVEDFDSGQLRARRDVSAKPHPVSLSPDGCCVFVGGQGGDALVWMWKEDRLLTLSGAGQDLTRADFDADGKRLVTIGGKNSTEVAIWTLGSKPARAHLLAHEVEVTDVALHPAGNFILTGSTDHTARIWSLETNAPVAELVHRADISVVAFHPDGKLAVSGGGRSDRRVRLWYWRPEDLIAEACARLPAGLSKETWAQHLGKADYRESCRSTGAGK